MGEITQCHTLLACVSVINTKWNLNCNKSQEKNDMSVNDLKSDYAPVATNDEKSKLEKMELEEAETKVILEFSIFFPLIRSSNLYFTHCLMFICDAR